ncbi:MAG: alpha/beta fold hydrolase [Candidatus Bruticola sp.]
MKKVRSDAWKPLYPFASNYMYVPNTGLRMHFIDECQAEPGREREPIVCVHGNPTWSYYYRELVKAFRPHHRVIVPDHIGMGLSDKPQHYNYCLSSHIDNFELLMDKLNLEPFTMVVHDWGGAIGLGYAVRHPEKVKRILFLNTAAYRSPFMPSVIKLARVPVLGSLLVRGLNAFVIGALLISTKRPISSYTASGYIAPYNSWSNRIGVLRFVQDIPMDQSHPSYQTLKEIELNLPKLASIPKTFVWGGLDRVFNDNFLRRWQTIYPDAEFHRLNDAGHYVMEDASEVVFEHLRNLLAR